MATVLDTLVTEIIFKGDTSCPRKYAKALEQFHVESRMQLGRQLGLASGAISGIDRVEPPNLSPTFKMNSAKTLAPAYGAGILSRAVGPMAVNRLLNTMRELQPYVRQALAEALFFVASAGLRGKEAMEVLEQCVANASGRHGRSPRLLPTMTTSAINAYG